MRILHWSQLFSPSKGGIETTVKELVVGIKKLGCTVEVLCVGDGADSTQASKYGYIVHYCSFLFKYAGVYFSYKSIIKWFKIRNNYDVVHVHLPHPLANLALFIFRTNAMIVLHWHSDIVRQKRLKLLYAPLQRWFLKRADAIIVTTAVYANSSALENFKEKVVVIPIGISPMRLMSEYEKKKEIQKQFSGKVIIFALGRHVYYKGFKWLIQAISFLPANYVLFLGGVGPLKETLQKQARCLGLGSRIVFLGKISDTELGTYYDSCNIFCLPSVERSEAFGIVQLEAMRFGKPIVSTSIPGAGVSWVNRDGVTGKTVPPRDAHALARAIREVTSCPPSSHQILEYFERNFLADKMARRVMDLYSNLLGRH